ncbi:MAG: hydantoinase/oxoprolinase family protein [Candidatus Thorarchaeota archaeon]
MRVVGLDIGGANLKGCGLTLDDDGVPGNLIYRSKSFPIWQRDRLDLWNLIADTVYELADTSEAPELVSVVMTAELSDTFETKRDGVTTIANGVHRTFRNIPIIFPDVNLELLELEEVLNDPLRVAAANWPVLAWTVGRGVPNCILIDVGSTTTDIIPIKNGLPVTRGRNDTNRLMSGELVYTGALRTNISAILREVELDGVSCRVSSEYFATSADVHLVLGHIAEHQHSHETADGRGKSLEECKARLARVVCGDIETIPEDQIVDIARQAWTQQLRDITSGVLQVCAMHDLNPTEEVFVFSGVGAVFLGRSAMASFDIKEGQYLQDILGPEGATAATAFAAALYAARNWR